MKSVYIKLGLTLLACVFAFTAYFGWLDQTGEQYTQQGLKRALVTYGVARGLNGVISVAQGTELAFEPVGVGLTFTPGQILDPVNDLIERFSWVVLASGASLGVQSVLIKVTSWSWFSGISLIFLFFSVLSLWKYQIFSASVKNIIFKATLLLVVIRFCIPIIAIINETLYFTFLEPQYIEAKQNLEKTADDIEKLNNQQQPINVDRVSTSEKEETASLIEQVKSVYASASNALDIKGQLDALKSAVSKLSENTLNMIVVFVVQTLIFPLFFLWMTVLLLKFIFNFKPPES